MAYTPGPWKGHGKWLTNIKDENGEMIATVWNIGEDVAPHNAHLIAAAPEMLEVCQFALEKLNRMTTDEFSKGGDKEIREKLDRVLAQVGE